jgi:hypothetical protein
MFIRLGLNNEKSIHTLLLQSIPLLSFHLYSLHLQTLRLVTLVNLIIKTYRISQCNFSVQFNLAGTYVK